MSSLNIQRPQAVLARSPSIDQRYPPSMTNSQQKPYVLDEPIYVSANKVTNHGAGGAWLTEQPVVDRHESNVRVVSAVCMC
jgi:hypothetical protein